MLLRRHDVFPFPGKYNRKGNSSELQMKGKFVFWKRVASVRWQCTPYCFHWKLVFYSFLSSWAHIWPCHHAILGLGSGQFFQTQGGPAVCSIKKKFTTSKGQFVFVVTPESGRVHLDLSKNYANELAEFNCGKHWHWYLLMASLPCGKELHGLSLFSSKNMRPVSLIIQLLF